MFKSICENISYLKHGALPADAVFKLLATMTLTSSSPPIYMLIQLTISYLKHVTPFLLMLSRKYYKYFELLASEDDFNRIPAIRNFY